MTIGMGLQFSTNIDLSAKELVLLSLQIGANFHQCLVWTIPPFVVQVLLNYLNKESIKKDEDLVQKCKKCVHFFEGLTLSFSSFFVLYFTLIQIYSIFMTFIFIRYIFKMAMLSFQWQGVLYLISFLTGLSCNIIWLMTLTNSVDKTNECVKSLGSQIQEKLLVTEGTQERRNLKFLKQRVNDLKPMNASGYFTIDKTTLTSMLSVR